MAKRNKKLTFEEELKKFEESIRKQKSVPFNKLSKEDQSLIVNYSTNGNSSTPSDIIITEKDCEESLKSSGQLTDEQLETIKKTFSREDLKKLITAPDELIKLIKDDVKFEEMMGYVTSLFTSGSHHKSFDEIVSRFFHFHLGKMDLRDLVNLKYKLETLIQEKAKEEKEPTEYNEQKFG